MPPDASATVDAIYRSDWGRIVATLIRLVGDFDVAEDAAQEAFAAAVDQWPASGTPEFPRAWIIQTARHKAIDRLRRRSRFEEKLESYTELSPASETPDYDTSEIPDDQLRLIFTCCHPALPREAQIALTLRVVCGMTTAQIARAFLVQETTMAQRITRAKRKITDAGTPYRIPADDELGARLTEVLAVIYLLFNEGYLCTAERAQSRDLVDDAEWLASLLHELMPTEPEVGGLLALIRLHHARAAARFDLDGHLVLLQDQDRSLWDGEAIAQATQLLARTAKQHRPGPYQLQAAIVACHAEAKRWQDTDWEQIVLLYDMLLHLAPSPVTRLHRAIALRYTSGPQAAMIELDTLADVLDRYHLYHATRADLQRELGHPDQARAADSRALKLTANPAEQAVLRERIAWT